MSPVNDQLITRLTVRISSVETTQVIGTGVLYSSEYLNDKIYIITAAHCLFEDGDSFLYPRREVQIDIFEPVQASYISFICPVNTNLSFKDKDKDVAILILDKYDVEQRTGEIPQCPLVKTRALQGTFAIKGFPKATFGQELDFIAPLWKQGMDGVPKFQLYLNADYDEWAVAGFSGSGIFINSGDKLHLYGIFARYREEGKGRTIYGQLIESLNELLSDNFLPELQFSFLGSHGLDVDFFREHIQQAVTGLGPRFDAALNFRTPDVKLFDALAKDRILRGRLHKIVDNWLEHGSRLHIKEHKYTKVLHTILSETTDYLVKWWQSINWAADAQIAEQGLTDLFTQLIEVADKTLSDLYKQREAEERKLTHEALRKKLHRPYDNEIYYLRELSVKANEFVNDLSDLSIQLANKPLLIVRGEAGAGKSHLLGDIATLRTQLNKPTILLLGQHFSRHHSIWDNIANQLGVSLNKDQLLDTLQTIGVQSGSRVLLLIDALNEGDGKQIWPDGIAAFLTEVQKYPYIGICVSVRTTYVNAILPESIIRDNSITKIDHTGFKGNEYAALKLFCQHYGLQQPSIPILAPEFSSPLFLRIMCQGLYNTGQTSFPEGFHGFSKVFKHYLRSVAEKLIQKRDIYEARTHLIEKAIAKIADFAFQNPSGIVGLDTAVETFDKEFPLMPNLLADLIQEGIFIQSIYQEYKTGIEKETVYFAYERFGDFIIAEQLLSSYDSAAALKNGLHDNLFAKDLMGRNRFYHHSGIIEAFAILLPERFGVELFEYIGWVIGEHGDSESDYWHIWRDVDRTVIDSLKWRETGSIKSEEILLWMRRRQFSIGVHECLLMLLELTAIPGHPFNADWLYQWMSKRSMPERDAVWQLFIYYYHKGDGEGQPYAVTRILEWAWQPGISALAGSEPARLVGKCLAWYLSATNKQLRDKATKAMINLLYRQPEALLATLKSFESVDDMYIRERIWAVAYGCVLRMPDEEIGELAQYAFDRVFADGNPPEHLLLRDYARNIIEYAVYRQIPVQADLTSVRPPYNSLLPKLLPTDADIEKYDMPRDAPESKKDEARIAGRIHFDVMDWNFGEKDINYALNLFSSESFTMERKFKEACRSLKPEARRMVKLLAKMLQTEHMLETDRFARVPDVETYKADTQEFIKTTIAFVIEHLDAEQHAFIIKQWLPYARKKHEYTRGIDTFDSKPLRRYIVQQAHTLGFDMKLHGEFDRLAERHSHYDSNTELIGRKYARIAFYEALCIAADNYYVAERKRSGKSKVYDGPWENYLRDIDPGFLTSRSDRNLYEESYQDDPEKEKQQWWAAPRYEYWNYPATAWIEMQTDLPDMKQVIQRFNAKKKWLYLDLYMQWKEPKPVGKSQKHIARKEVYYSIDACIIKKKDKQKVIRYIERNDMEHIYIPDGGHPSGVFNRENYWSPAALYHHPGTERWFRIAALKCRAMLASEMAVGEMSDDDSEAHFQYRMPSRTLFNGMRLTYGERDGDFTDEQGNVLAHNDNPRGLIVDQQALTEYLNSADLDIIWIVYGEKRIFSWDNIGKDYFKEIKGVYHLDDSGNINGALKMTDRT